MNRYTKEDSYFFDSISFIMEGTVVDTSDPDQMGRLRVHIASLDGEEYEIEKLPWCDYASPFMGYTSEYPHGNNEVQNHASSAYGFWAIPKLGATVLVFFLNGNPSSRFYFASTARLHRNRSLPAGRNIDFHDNLGPFGDAGDGSGFLNPIQPAYDNLRTQFQNNMSAPEALTRGAYERQVGQAKTEKDGAEGYSPNPADPSYLDPQTICFTTPGGHAIIMQDDPQFSRLRIKTGSGNQIILDDANERIYVSSAKGNSWYEMDVDGHVHVFGSESMSFRTGKDFNLRADGDINLEAGGGINIKAEKKDIKIQAQNNIHIKSNKDTVISACGIFDMSSETTLKITAISDMDIAAHSRLKASGDNGVDIKGGAVKIGGDSVDIKGGPVKIVGSPLTMNSGAADANKASDATCATNAAGPTIVPGFEPWSRPESPNPRGKNWKK